MNISLNRTLICLQISQEPPIIPGFIYDMNSLQDVFNYINPTVEVELVNTLGETKTETFVFETLHDFNLFRIMEQSEILTELIQQLATGTGNTNYHIQNIVRNLNHYNHQDTKAVKENIKKILTAVKTIEESYRTLDLYFLNRKNINPGSITILNAALEQLNDLDNTTFFDSVNEELKNSYSKFDMSNCYSFLLIPGFLWTSAVLEKYKKLTDSYKIQLFTDLYNGKTFDHLITYFEMDNFQPNPQLVLGANYLRCRNKYDFLDESEGDMPMIGCSGLLLAANSEIENMGNIALLVTDDYFACGPNISYSLQELKQIQKLCLNPLLYQENKIISPGNLLAFCDLDFKLLSSANHIRILNFIAKSAMNKLNEVVFKPEQTFSFLSTRLLGDACNRAIYEMLTNCSNYFTTISSYSSKQLTDNYNFSWYSDQVDNSRLNLEVLLEFDDSKDGAIISLHYNTKEGICEASFNSVRKEIFADGICPEPLGNTLFAANFSNEYDAVECIDGFKDINDVFARYRPMISLKQRMFNGDKEEWLGFDTVSDFSFNSIKERSTVLSSLEWLQNTFNSNIERLKGDVYFENILSTQEIKFEYCTCLTVIQLMLKGEIDSKTFAEELNKHVTKCGGFDFFKYSIDSDKIFTLANFKEVNHYGIHLKRRSKVFKELLLKMEYWEYLINQSHNFEQLALKYRLANTEMERDFESQKQIVLSESAEMSRSYRALDVFLSNSQTSSMKGISLVSYKKDTSSQKVINVLKDAITIKNERIDIRNSIQFLVIPEWNWNEISAGELADFLYQQNVILFANAERSNYSYMKTFDSTKAFAGFDRKIVSAANVCLSSDWLTDNNYDFATFIPTCSALAGKAKWDTYHPGVSSTYFLPEEFSNIVSAFSDEDKSIFESHANCVSITQAFNDVVLKNSNTLYEGEKIALNSYHVNLLLQRIKNIFTAKLPAEHLEAPRVIDTIEAIKKTYSLYIDEMSLMEYDSWNYIKSFAVNIKFKYVEQPIVLRVKISEGDFLRLAFEYE